MGISFTVDVMFHFDKLEKKKTVKDGCCVGIAGRLRDCIFSRTLHTQRGLQEEGKKKKKDVEKWVTLEEKRSV